MRRRVTSLTAFAGSVLLWAVTGYQDHGAPIGHLAHVQTAFAQVVSFIQSFNGSPTAPQPFSQHPEYANWDVQVHSRAPSRWASLDPIQAQHGSDCSGPPAAHSNTS